MRLALALALVATGASAHLLPPQHATVNLVAQDAFVVASVPVSALHGFDDDGDGLLSDAELRAHRSALAEQLRTQLVVLGTSVLALDLFFEPRDDDPTHRADHLVVLEHARFPEVPEAVTLRLGAFGAGASEQRFEVLATRKARTESETALFVPGAAERTFFAPPRRPPPALLAGGVVLLLGAAVATRARRKG